MKEYITRKLCYRMLRYYVFSVTTRPTRTSPYFPSPFSSCRLVYNAHLNLVFWFRGARYPPFTQLCQSNLLVKNSPATRKSGWACCQWFCIARAIIMWSILLAVRAYPCYHPWHEQLRTGRWGSSALVGSPPRRRKTPIPNLRCLATSPSSGKG